MSVEGPGKVPQSDADAGATLGPDSPPFATIARRSATLTGARRAVVPLRQYSLSLPFLTYIELLCIMQLCTRAFEFVSPTRRLRIMEINKDLIAASSTPLVLAILAEEDSYGYAILQRVRELSGGRMEWTDGMLYPVLHRLERLGHVEARWEVAESGRRRKYYRITRRGRAQLAEERRQWQAVDAALRSIWRGLSLCVPGGRPALAAPLPQGA